MSGNRTQELAALQSAMRNTLAAGLMVSEMDTMAFNDWLVIAETLDEFTALVYNWVHRKSEAPNWSNSK